MIINSPLSVPISKNKKFILNLNNYRNAHYNALNIAKKAYLKIIGDQLIKLHFVEKAKVRYKLFPGTRRRTDIGNVISIHKKFFEDAIVDAGIISDDDYKHIIASSESFGEVDKKNPRVEIVIMPEIEN